MSQAWSEKPPFARWLQQTQATLIARASAQVPCGSCTACCRSSQFIHIEENEPAFAAIPEDLLVPAPGMEGVWLMGHQNGLCPMFKDETCSIYHERPQTCRSYDCRIFHAADQYPRDQPEITARAAQECFDYGEQSDRDRSSAVREAAGFINAHQQELFGRSVNEIQIALTAIKVHEQFLTRVLTRVDEGERLAQVRAALPP